MSETYIDFDCDQLARVLYDEQRPLHPPDPLNVTGSLPRLCTLVGSDGRYCANKTTQILSLILVSTPTHCAPLFGEREENS